MESLFVEWIYVVFFVLTCRIVTGRNPKMCPGGILGPLLSSPKCTFWYPYDLLGHSFQLHFDFCSVRCVLLEKKMRLCFFATLPRFGLVWAGFGLVLVIKGGLGVPLGGSWGALGGPEGTLGAPWRRTAATEWPYWSKRVPAPIHFGHLWASFGSPWGVFLMFF